MPRINKLDLNQINRQIDRIDSITEQLGSLQNLVNNVGFQATIADPQHAPSTTNNLTFTWTGGTTTLSWNAGYIKSKNWSAPTLPRPAAISSAPGAQHIFPVAAGTLSLTPSTYYWLGWDSIHQQMIATQDASSLHANKNMHIICQIFTGTAGQTGAAGGGGSSGVSDLSGVRYKLF